jgi:hypothetical protein
LKKAATYLLLLAYLFVQMKPLTAVFCDLTAHIFFRASHMATVHYENGHYHLHAELSEASKESDAMKSEKKSSSEKAAENSPQDIEDSRFNMHLIPSAVRLDGIYHDWAVASFLEADTPPPRIIL